MSKEVAQQWFATGMVGLLFVFAVVMFSCLMALLVAGMIHTIKSIFAEEVTAEDHADVHELESVS